MRCGSDKMKNKFATLMVISFWLLSLAQCGSEDSLSSDVKLVFVPDDPVVINADFKLNAGTDFEKTVAAPWFIFRAGVINNSDKILSLVTFTFKVTGFGGSTDYESSIDPSVTCDPETNGDEVRAYIAEIPAGAEYRAIANDGTSLLSACNESITDTVSNASGALLYPASVLDTGTYEGWYIDSLPDQGDDNFTYNVDVIGEGWFTDPLTGEALERLELEDSLFTK
jgi:hypothetical protein